MKTEKIANEFGTVEVQNFSNEQIYGNELNLAKELNLLRKALEKAEEARFAKGLDDAQREELEKASVILRVKERELINKIGVEIAAQIKESSESLEELVKAIRQRSAGLSKTAKKTDAVTKALEKVIEAVVLIKSLK